MTCRIPDCDRPVRVKSKQLCGMHYARERTRGSAEWQPPTREDRFWSKVDQGDVDGCWDWIGGLNDTGYGIFSWREDGNVQSRRAHRFAYEQLIGPILEGLHLDHLCRRPCCVNPSHLEPVTPRVNMLRGIGPGAINATATHCKHGHAFTDENVWIDRKRNTRHCRECNRRRWHEWNARREALVNAHVAEAALARTGPEWTA